MKILIPASAVDVTGNDVVDVVAGCSVDSDKRGMNVIERLLKWSHSEWWQRLTRADNSITIIAVITLTVILAGNIAVETCGQLRAYERCIRAEGSWVMEEMLYKLIIL